MGDLFDDFRCDLGGGSSRIADMAPMVSGTNVWLSSRRAALSHETSPTAICGELIMVCQCEQPAVPAFPSGQV